MYKLVIEEHASDIYGQLIHQYQNMMYYAALKIVKDNQLAEDIVQESWIKVIQYNRPLQGIEKLGAWLRTITTRTAIDMIRKENIMKTYLFEEACLIEELKINSCNELEDRLNWLCTYNELEESLKNNAKLADIFHLKFRMDLDDQEIASKLDLSLSAVKSRVFRTRQVLKKEKQQPLSLAKPGA